jgi:hypothetical protein
MPREEKTKICQNYEEVKCMIEANNYWISHKTSNTTSIKPCDCLDTCNNVDYFVRFLKSSELKDENSVGPTNSSR